MKKMLGAIVIALAFACAANAQSVEKITEIIDSQETTFGQASYLALSYSEKIDEDASYQDALQTAVELGWVKDGAEASSSLNLKEYSALCVKAAGMKGGLFYKLTKAPRYAFKELKALGFLDKEADPWKKISGQDAVNLFNVCVNYAEASR